ncbi:RICIN domain-containing protein [Streptomyces sp. NPDC056943]|uniref:RICIN domain-containing protein n=1 Tax=Streptomyces sp. NPDC056943 TaxID=3345971 RepID=UPI0036267871
MGVWVPHFWGGSTANGTSITVWTCTGHDSQQWDWNGSKIVHRQSGKCLTDPGWGDERGAAARRRVPT